MWKIIDVCMIFLDVEIKLIRIIYCVFIFRLNFKKINFIEIIRYKFGFKIEYIIGLFILGSNMFFGVFFVFFGVVLLIILFILIMYIK